MKVLLMKDVYKLGRAGDIKKVADGYGRNFLLPQGLAVLATEGAMKQVQKIKAQAEVRRNTQNDELKGVADLIKEATLIFPAKAGETGKLYGSITTQDIATALSEKIRHEIKRQLVDTQPIRTLGEFTAHVRLTMDLNPEVKIIVHREGESIETAVAPVEEVEEKAEKPKKAKKEKEATQEAAETAE
jgi:large subunit ribosomal protein L9